MRRTSIAVLILALAALLPSCGSPKSGLPVKKLTLITSHEEKIVVRAEIASTFEQRQRGFMFRQEIPDGTGMLFIFEDEQVLDFWMKNTPHPLSIAYIDRNGRIRDILDMTPFSLADVSSSVKVLYALEVPQGWFDRAGVKTGDRLILDF